MNGIGAQTAMALGRALLIALLALAVSTPLTPWLTAQRGRARLLAWLLLLAPFFTPPLLVSYGLARFSLALLVSAWGHEMLYIGVLALKLIPLAVVLRVLLPSPLSAESRHTFHMLAPAAWWPRTRFLLRAAGPGPWIAAGLVFLLAFADFELASLWSIKTWTMAVFDAQIGGYALSATMRLALYPLIVQLGVLIALVAALGPEGRAEISRSASATGKRSSRIRPGGAGDLQHPAGAGAQTVRDPVDADRLISITPPALGNSPGRDAAPPASSATARAPHPEPAPLQIETPTKSTKGHERDFRFRVLSSFSWFPNSFLRALSAEGRRVPPTPWIYLTLSAFVVCLLPLLIVCTQAISGIPSLLENFVLGGELGASVVFALVAAATATFLAASARQSLARAPLLLTPGLLGALIVSLLLLALFQAPLVHAFYDTPLPLLLALILLLLPLALLLTALWLRPTPALHIARQLGSRRLIWDLETQPRVIAAGILFCWAYFDFTASSILAPTGFTPVFVRLHNLAHYGQTAVLSAMMLAAFATPILVLLLTGTAWRLYARGHGR